MKIRFITFFCFLQFLIFNVQSSFGQSGTWTWISGDNSINSPGVYGTQGVPSVNNHPPGEYEPIEWKDKQGNFWIYGGTYPFMSDLWKYNPVTNEWTWVKGDSGILEFPVYGMRGISNPSNTPGSRAFCAATWVDTSGNFWLFGTGNRMVPDLWKYDIGSNQWTWMKGDTLYPNGVYGTQGIPSPSNTPGGRNETCSAWTDSMNNLWLFGGLGIADSGTLGLLNDLWNYDITTNEWTWMKGSDTVYVLATYGVKGVPTASNDPGGRQTYTKWKDMQDNFWLMGGFEYNNGTFNDVWKYDLSANEWIWMDGSDVANHGGNYLTKCVFDTINIPGYRFEQRSSVTDYCGRFWLFGGGDAPSDLWVFDPQQLEWKWLSGTNNGSQYGSYGTLGVSSPSNIPPLRKGAVAWWGNDDKFYMFGGAQEGLDTFYCFSDVWVFDPDTNCISICTLPAVADFQSSNVTFCVNDCINFTDLSTNATSWQWLFAGATDSTSTSQNPQNICYSKTGIYNVTLIASNIAGSDTVMFSNYITVNATPPIPIITQHLNHDTLYCSFDTSYVSYQWFYDSTLIAGATDTFLVVSKSGNYNVQVTNKNGCQIAGGINVVLGIENYSINNFITLYPNPATDEILIDGNWKMEDGNLKLTIINVLGQTIYTEELNRKPSTVNCQPFPSGIYFLEMQNETGRWVGRFMKE